MSGHEDDPSTVYPSLEEAVGRAIYSMLDETDEGAIIVHTSECDAQEDDPGCPCEPMMLHVRRVR